MDKRTKGSKSHLWHVLRFGVAFIAIYFAFRGQSVVEVGEIFSNISIWVFLFAFGIYILSQLLFVFRWKILLWVVDVKIKFWPAVRLHLLGLFYNNCLPSSVGGDLVRAWYVTKHTDKKVAAAMTVFVDRAIGLVCTVGLIFIAYWFVPTPEGTGKVELSTANMDIAGKISKVLPILAIFVLALLVILIILLTVKKTRRPLVKLIVKFKSKFIELLFHFLEISKMFLCKPFGLLLAIICSLTCQTMAVTSFWLIGRNLGIEAHIKYYLMFFPLSWIIGVIPISIGGAGVVELGIKGMFSMVTSVTALQGLVLGLTQRLIILTFSLPGVLIHIFGGHLPSEEQMTSEIEDQTTKPESP